MEEPVRSGQDESIQENTLQGLSSTGLGITAIPIQTTKQNNSKMRTERAKLGWIKWEYDIMNITEISIQES